LYYDSFSNWKYLTILASYEMNTCFHSVFVIILIYLHSIFHCWCIWHLSMHDVIAFLAFTAPVSHYCSHIMSLSRAGLWTELTGATEKLNTTAFKRYRPRLN